MKEVKAFVAESDQKQEGEVGGFVLCDVYLCNWMLFVCFVLRKIYKTGQKKRTKERQPHSLHF